MYQQINITMTEEFKEFPIKKFNNRYKVSSYGQIFSNLKKKYLKTFTFNGYEHVLLKDKDKKIQFRVDKLIATSFIGDSDLYLEHIDGNKKNSNISNLRWISIIDYLVKKYDCQWKKIDGYENYFVSSEGQIFSLYNEEFLKQYINNGYMNVKIGLERKYFHTNRLVAISFIENPNNYPVVNHKDGNKINNMVDNLEWVTRSENVIHSLYVLGNKDKKLLSKKEKTKEPLDAVELSWLKMYLITKDGKVYSKKTNIFLKEACNEEGYISIRANKKHYRVNRLVAFAYLPKPLNDQCEVNHKNLIRNDNRVENLEWSSPSNNTNHSKINNPQQHEHLRKKVACINKDTNEIIKIYNSACEAYKITGIHKSSISRTCKNVGTLAGGFKWKYIE